MGSTSKQVFATVTYSISKYVLKVHTSVTYSIKVRTIHILSVTRVQYVLTCDGLVPLLGGHGGGLVGGQPRRRLCGFNTDVYHGECGFNTYISESVGLIGSGGGSVWCVCVVCVVFGMCVCVVCVVCGVCVCVLCLVCMVCMVCIVCVVCMVCIVCKICMVGGIWYMVCGAE
jgi:hypothetical protein